MRRWVMLFTALAAGWLMGRVSSAADSTVAAPSTTVVGRDWPLVRGDALATGVAATTLPESLDLLWKFSVPKGEFVTTPIIVDGVVYIGDRDGIVRAFDLANGAKKWEFTAQAGFFASASYHEGRLYLGDGDGLFYCLSAADGKVQWTFRSGAEIDSSANFYNGNVLFGSEDSMLYCLDANSGKLVWKRETADQVQCPPTVVDDRAFVAGCDGKLHIFDAKKGESLDTVDIDDPTGCTPAVQGSVVYFGTEAGSFFAIDWKQPKILWRWQDKIHSDEIRSSAALTPEAVIFGDRRKRVRALDPASGKPIWEQTMHGRIDSSPVVVGERVFVASSDGRIHGLDRRTGKTVWTYEAGGEFTGSPAVAAHRLVIASEDGVVYCFGAK